MRKNIIAEGSEFMPDVISCGSPVPDDPLQLAAIEIHGRVIKEEIYEFICNVREFQNSHELGENGCRAMLKSRRKERR